VGVEVGVGVAGVVVPQDEDGQVRQPQGCGALDRGGQSVVGVARAEELLAVLDRLFDGPAGGVPGDDLLRGAGQVGGGQGQGVGPGLVEVSDED
jgi:hypothetical protein